MVNDATLTTLINFNLLFFIAAGGSFTPAEGLFHLLYSTAAGPSGPFFTSIIWAGRPILLGLVVHYYASL